MDCECKKWFSWEIGSVKFMSIVADSCDKKGLIEIFDHFYWDEFELNAQYRLKA